MLLEAFSQLCLMLMVNYLLREPQHVKCVYGRLLPVYQCVTAPGILVGFTRWLSVLMGRESPAGVRITQYVSGRSVPDVVSPRSPAISAVSGRWLSALMDKQSPAAAMMERYACGILQQNNVCRLYRHRRSASGVLRSVEME